MKLLNLSRIYFPTSETYTSLQCIKSTCHLFFTAFVIYHVINIVGQCDITWKMPNNPGLLNYIVTNSSGEKDPRGMIVCSCLFHVNSKWFWPSFSWKKQFAMGPEQSCTFLLSVPRVQGLEYSWAGPFLKVVFEKWGNMICFHFLW